MAKKKFKKVRKGDRNYTLIANAIKEGRVKLALLPELIGKSSARKTLEFITYDRTPEEALSIAKEIMLEPGKYHGRLEMHHNQKDVVYILDGHVTMYVKAMFQHGILWVDVHAQDFDKM